MSDAKTTETLRVALRERYRDAHWENYGRAPGDVLLEEVQINGRSADAIRIGCWASRGYVIEGFEIKASRSDWLRELKEPAKAEEIAARMDRWWIVAPSGVVKKDELPATWGLLSLRKDGKLVVAVQAPRRDPPPPSRMFIAMLVRAGFMASREALRRERDSVYRRIEEQVQKRLTRSDPDEWLKERVAELEEDIAAFEAASGVRLRERWDSPERTGALVRWAREAMRRGRLDPIDIAVRSLGQELQRVTALRDLLREAVPPLADAEQVQP